MNSTPPHATRQYTRSTGVKLFEADSHIPIWQSLQKGLKTRDTVFMPGKAQFRLLIMGANIYIQILREQRPPGDWSTAKAPITDFSDKLSCQMQGRRYKV